MEESELVIWVLGGFGLILFTVATMTMQTKIQIAVLQKTVDILLVKMDKFLKDEMDALKDIVNRR
jgi:hypothetical protein